MFKDRKLISKNSVDINGLLIQLREFSKNLQNNIHVGALRQASNVVKKELAGIQTQQIGKSTGRLYRKSFKTSSVKVTKRRRTRAGWDRFKVRIDAGVTIEDPKGLRYNVMQNNTYNRFTKKRYFRGRVERDQIMARAVENAEAKARYAFIVYMRERIKVDGKKISARKFRASL